MWVDGMVSKVQGPSTARCVLRVFSGPLQGCEFTLQDRTLFVVGSEADFCDIERPLSVPEDAIYIPLEFGGCNFEILLEQGSRLSCAVRMLSDEGPVERALSFQTLEAIGGLQIAVRPIDEAWDEQLLERALPVALSPVTTRTRGYWLPRLAVCGAVVLMVGLSAFEWTSSGPSPVANMEALVDGADRSMKVVYGRDQAVYVFAETERDAGWGRQVLVRNGHSATQVVTTYGERLRLEGLLEKAAPQLAYHRVDLSDPLRPRLLISSQRNLLTPRFQTRLEKALISAAPYALEAEVVSYDDDSLSGQAEEGLRRLGVPFSRDQHVDSVTFTIEGNLEDGELQELGDFVVRFNQQWGERYVHFAIELKDELLKSKSFQYGPQGYIKMNPTSWYFPVPL